jgi:hypothetical protein
MSALLAGLWIAMPGGTDDGWQIIFWAIYFLNYVFTLSISCLAFGQN